MAHDNPPTAFVTFYSFKGGVGRSMALLNTAGMLAGRGFRVLVIDLDLEAPGLSYLAPGAPLEQSPIRIAPTRPNGLNSRAGPPRPGFVDLLSDAKHRGIDADLFALTAVDLRSRYTQAYILPNDIGEFHDGSLHIMPAGQFDGEYTQRFDTLNLHELYLQGIGEPLIRAFKQKLVDSGLFDYVLVDSRTGFSDEAGICTRDLADHLMILSGLNRQNVEGTSAFLQALRTATGGKKSFEIILSPVPNGEDALVDEREAIAKAAFSGAWGADVQVDLQIPYHPQLALTEEPHIFRRRRGYLFDAYRAIERRMLLALGHDARRLAGIVESFLRQAEYRLALRNLRHMIRLDGGRLAASRLADELATDAWSRAHPKGEANLGKESVTLNDILKDTDGQHVIEFIIDQCRVDDRTWGLRRLSRRLGANSIELADRLFRRIVTSAGSDASDFSEYALFLADRRNDLDGAAANYRRAIEVDPTDTRVLSRYAAFLALRRGDIDGAMNCYEQALKINPKDINILLRFAFFLEQHRRDVDAADALLKEAVAADPNDVSVLGTYASFLVRARGDLDGAEKCYVRAVEAAPKDAGILGSYAVFLERRLGDADRAGSFYKRAVEAGPRNANLIANYGQYLAGRGLLAESESALTTAMGLDDRSDAGNTAETCLALWLVLKMQGRDGQHPERRFKSLLQRGFQRHWWSFDLIMRQAESRLSPGDAEYARALIAAFFDPEKVPALDKFDLWRTLEPLNLDPPPE